ncbi:adenylate/guanylate cyclase domain-containing protein [Christiangramia echinicola]|uniref:adenylate/guanylate cyclase domain-containing protein n=1 Tax=Christiangramia echinicola TaxID=279359 RepID=UPI00041CB9D1|nr:adenylate/guanylate cyclase domain-containing protein [Christiangramia echinicola]
MSRWRLIYSIKLGLSKILILTFFLFLPSHLYSQQETSIEDMEKEYENSGAKKNDLSILYELSNEITEPNKKVKYSQELVRIAKAKDCTKYVFAGYFQLGNAYQVKGDYSKALESYFNAAENTDSDRELGQIKLVTGDVYSLSKNFERSVKYYDEAIQYFRGAQDAQDSTYLGSGLFNAGDGYLKNNQLDKAFSYIQEAGLIFDKLDFVKGAAYCVGTLGLIYAKQGENEKAEENIQDAIQKLEKEEDYAPICEFLTAMADIYTEKNDEAKALEFALLSRELATAYGFKNEIIESNLKLSEIYEKTGDIPESYRYYKEFIIYRDSVINVETAQSIAGLRADYEVDQKQAEFDLLNEKQKNQQLVLISIAVALFLLGLLAFGLYRRNRFINKTSAIIEKERNRSDRLLLNILPEETAKELKKNGKVKAQKFASVTVLFADFKRFTLVAEKLTPERLIKTVDYYFSQFDRIMDKHGVEKIKTIGDSYMAASGLPFPSHDHASRILKAAFEMTEFVQETKDKALFDDADFEVRIGLNSGPVVAGVVGIKKFAYDIWGDTVNIAARMESHSEIGRINISENTYELIKHEFHCEYRGEVEVKNQRILKMYYVNAVKENIDKKAV